MLIVSSRLITSSWVTALLAITMMPHMIEGFGIVTPSPAFTPSSSSISPWTTSSSTSRLSMMAGGFGGGGDGASKKKKKDTKETKLKPKAQWDRYSALKKDSIVRVGVKIVGDNDNDDWLEVGRIKSKGNAYTEIAVARQRAIIADHARRLFPLQVSAKDTVQWGYLKEDGDGQAPSQEEGEEGGDNNNSSGEWVVVDKSVLTDAQKGIEKEIGFEGRPDPATGFYCHYSEGRLVAE